MLSNLSKAVDLKIPNGPYRINKLLSYIYICLYVNTYVKLSPEVADCSKPLNRLDVLTFKLEVSKQFSKDVTVENSLSNLGILQASEK